MPEKEDKEQEPQGVPFKGEIYFNATDGARFLHIERSVFYSNVVPHVQAYNVGALKGKYYKKSDLLKFLEVRPVQEGES